MLLFNRSLRLAHGKPLLVLPLLTTLLLLVEVVAALAAVEVARVVLEQEQHFPLPQELLIR
jgi:hypothetical protein